MKNLKKSYNLLMVSTKQDNDIIIYTETLMLVIKHNGIGISIDHYRRKEDEPFITNQVHFTD
jgi:transposase-like protein